MQILTYDRLFRDYLPETRLRLARPTVLDTDRLAGIDNSPIKGRS
ncbi:hypothetical protein ThimaDRAFT_1212 [Thiocapsa marina 5811]|uniref:Uncharacterized protein n=2 Tax=Thiocapsa marina TaxID=244573 RepID=F9U7Y6_9GAMM|nr:hypothetical protein ThimaDRAFT_1212 [Thiocapsa marina 5811]